MPAQLKMTNSPFLCLSPQHAGLAPDSPASAVCEDHRGLVESAGQQTLDALKKIQTDDRLSARGRGEAIEQAAKLALEHVAATTTKQQQTLSRQLAVAEAAIPPFPAIGTHARRREAIPEGETSHLASDAGKVQKSLAINSATDRLALDLRFLVQELKGMEQAERDGLLEEMSQRTDAMATTVLLAFRHATTLRPLASPERIEAAIEGWRRSNFPAEYAAVETIRQCQTLVDGNAKAVSKSLEQSAGLPQMSGMSSDIKLAV